MSLDAYVARPAGWPQGTHQFRDHSEMMAAIDAAQVARHEAEVRCVDQMTSDCRRHYLTECKKRRTPEMYALLRDALLKLRNERAAAMPADESMQGVLI